MRERRPDVEIVAPTPESLGVRDPLPAAALPEPSRKPFFNRRCQHDPLGEGRVCTWRSRCFKVAVEISVSARRALLRLSSSRPHLDELFRVGALVAAPSAEHGSS